MFNKVAKAIPPGQPWYRFPLVWLLIFIPAMTLVGSAITIYYAVSSTQSPVIDTYYKSGLSPNELADKEKKAAELGYEALVDFGAGDGEVKVTINKPISDESLLLIMQHPTLASKDLQITLKRQGLVDGQTLFVGQLGELPKVSHWYVRVESIDEHWRVLSRLEGNESKRTLTPYGS